MAIGKWSFVTIRPPRMASSLRQNLEHKLTGIKSKQVPNPH